jgi:DNA repair exonuclease SbcCD nuclease subunit
MPKFLFTADIHAHNWTQFSHVLDDGVNSRLSDCVSVIGQFADVARQHKCDAAFILGDIFHSRTKLDVDVVSLIYGAIADLCKSVPTYLLVGNHDCHAHGTDTHSLCMFRKVAAAVIDKPMAFSVSGVPFAAIPWRSSVDQLIAELADITTPTTFLLLHQGVNGAVVGPYSHALESRFTTSHVPECVQYVLLGDYHKRQTFGPRKNWQYVGSPMQLNFGEAGEFKAFTLANVKGGSVEFYDIPTTAPRFFKYESPEAATAAIEAESALPTDFVRVEYNQESAALSTLQEQYEWVQTVAAVERPEAMPITDASVLLSDALLLQEYVRLKNPEFDHEDLVAFGLELLEDSAL